MTTNPDLLDCRIHTSNAKSNHRTPSVSSPGGAGRAPPDDEFCALVLLSMRYLRSVSLKLCLNSADAEDLLQDTFERALQRSHQFRQGTDARSWLITIMRNLFIDRCRKEKRIPRMEAILTLQLIQPPSEPEPPWAILTTDDLKAALREIEAPYRQVFELYEFARHSYEEIAAQVGISPKTVGTRLHRARRRLRAALMRRVPTDPEEET